MLVILKNVYLSGQEKPMSNVSLRQAKMVVRWASEITLSSHGNWYDMDIVQLKTDIYWPTGQLDFNFFLSQVQSCPQRHLSL